jgi:hypothetical protein
MARFRSYNAGTESLRLMRNARRIAMNDNGTLRAVAWSEIFPWLSLVRCFRLAIRLRLLLLAAVAALLTFSGWTLFASIFPVRDAELAAEMRAHQNCPWLVASTLVPGVPWPLDRGLEPPPSSVFPRQPDPVFWSWQQLSSPLKGVFALDASVSEVAFLVLSGLWTILVWSFFGSAITRVAAVELASGERISWSDMLSHVKAKWLSYLGAPIVSLVGVLVLTVVVGLGGLILLRFGPGIIVGGILWPLVLAAGLLMAMLLLGLMFGWPLMWATISAEGTDCFDALSRGYAYVFQRPLHYLFYAIVAAIVGFLGWLLVSNFAAAVVYLGYWAASWGGGAAQVDMIRDGGEGLGMLGGFGALLIRFWCECVKLIAVGYLFSYFWTASTGIYFLLRRDVDATEMDEVFLDENESDAAYGLPSLKSDEQGAPVVDEPAEEPQQDGADN